MGRTRSKGRSTALVALFVVSLVLVVTERPTEAAPTPRRTFTAITPCRLVDTRIGTVGRIPAGASRAFQVTGTSGFETQGGTRDGCGIPEGAAAIEASVTAVQPGGTGFTRLWPDGAAAPNATFLNFSGVGSITNTGTIPVGTNGKVRLGHNGAASHDVIDVQGYFSTDATAARFDAVTPCRVADTRHDARGTIAPGGVRTLQVTGAGSAFLTQGGASGGCGIPADATAVELTLTAVTPAGPGFARAWPAGAAAPQATFLNFTAGRAITNTGTVALPASGRLELGGFGGRSHYVIDVQGVYRPTGPSSYVSVAPCRLVDTRADGAAAPSGPRSFQVAGLPRQSIFQDQGGVDDGCEIPSTAVAVEVSVTAVDATAPGYARIWADGGPAPTTTFLNYHRGAGTTNTGTVPVGANGKVRFGRSGGAIHVVVDVQGYFRGPGATRVASRHDGFEREISGGGTLSADGRYVAYATFRDVLVADQETGATARLTDDLGFVDHPVISDDGAYVAFISTSRHLAPGTGPTSVKRLYLWQRATATSVLIAEGVSQAPAISGDGSVVAYVRDDVLDLTLWDRATGTAQVLLDEAPGTLSAPDDLTPDGRFLGFTTSTNGADPTSVARVWDRDDGTFAEVAPGNGPSRRPALSDDGRHVAFESGATDLVTDPPGPDPNGATTDVFVRDRIAGTTTRLTGTPRPSTEPTIDGSGRYVAYLSYEVPVSSGPMGPDLVQWDRTTGASTVLVDVVGGSLHAPSFSPDGRYIGFVADGGNLDLTVPWTRGDAFVWDREG